MSNNLFWILALIDFESGRIDFHSLTEQYEEIFKVSAFEPDSLCKTSSQFDIARHQFPTQSNLFAFWDWAWKSFPLITNTDHWLGMKLGSHIDIAGLTFYGFNAMSWMICWETRRNYFRLRFPCRKCNGRFTWGLFYCSPNGSKTHANARIFWNLR